MLSLPLSTGMSLHKDSAMSEPGGLVHAADGEGVSCPGSVLFVLDPLLGHVTVRIRGLIFKELFQRDGWRVEYINLRPEHNPYDQAAIRQREQHIVKIASCFQVVYLLKVASLSLVQRLKRHSSATVVFDLTDALWKPMHRKAGWQDLEGILTQVDAIFSENEYICAYGRRHNGRVLSIPACTQVERFDQMRLSIPRRDDPRIVIGWVGSSGTARALVAIQEPLERLFGRYPNLELRVLGCSPASLPHFKNVAVTVLPDYDEDDMIREILAMDIGIYPPPSDMEDYRVRGALKGMLYMTGGIPAVCQNEGECRRVIQDGVTGMLASTKQEWFEKLDALVASPQLRREMGSRALQAIRAEHSLEHVYGILQEALLNVINPPQAREQKADGIEMAAMRSPPGRRTWLQHLHPRHWRSGGRHS